MKPARWWIVIGALAVATAASALAWGWPKDHPGATTVRQAGIGPLLLGMDYGVASAAAREVAPDSVLIGPGCGDRDEIRYSGRLGSLPVTVMAMADDKVINEVELTLDSPTSAPDESACVQLRGQLSEWFSARFGAPGESWVVAKPVSREHMVRIGPAVVAARWFPTGRSCYVGAVYGQPIDETARELTNTIYNKKQTHFIHLFWRSWSQSALAKTMPRARPGIVSPHSLSHGQ